MKNRKTSIALTNIIHLMGACLPSIYFFTVTTEDTLGPLICCSSVTITSATTALFWRLHLSKQREFDMALIGSKDDILLAANEFCFSRLWLIPNKVLIGASDARWSLFQKSNKTTIRKVTEFATDPLYLIFGLLATSAIWPAFIGNFGVAYSKIANIFGDGLPIQIGILTFGPWFAQTYLFNWFFRISPHREDKS
tara:strand:- start:508 stop:1092 length:585 start_codon:yes stop_codon:yes gene_type:complete